MTPKQTSCLFIAAVIVDVILEIKKIPVPNMVVLLAGFAIRHIATQEGQPLFTPKASTEVKP